MGCNPAGLVGGMPSSGTWILGQRCRGGSVWGSLVGVMWDESCSNAFSPLFSLLTDRQTKGKAPQRRWLSCTKHFQHLSLDRRCRH